MDESSSALGPSHPMFGGVSAYAVPAAPRLGGGASGGSCAPAEATAPGCPQRSMEEGAGAGRAPAPCRRRAPARQRGAQGRTGGSARRERATRAGSDEASWRAARARRGGGPVGGRHYRLPRRWSPWAHRRGFRSTACPSLGIKRDNVAVDEVGAEQEADADRAVDGRRYERPPLLEPIRPLLFASGGGVLTRRHCSARRV